MRIMRCVTAISTIVLTICFQSLSIQGSDVIAVKPNATRVQEGRPTTLRCKTIDKTSSVKCKWIWETTDDETGAIMVEEFDAYGESKNDCSLRVNNATLNHQGLWTCEVQLKNQSVYKSPSAMLHVTKKIIFKETPQNISISEGDNLLLKCTTDDEVQDCQWVFIDDDGTELEIVTTFKAGKNKNCSLVLNQVEKLQSGLWGCGVREYSVDDYTFTDLAHIFVDDRKITIDFVETPIDTIFVVGSNGSINCKTSEKIRQCRWFWQPPGYSDEHQVIMREFLPEDGHDCSLHFKDISTEPEGVWICAVLPYNSTLYVETKPVDLRIKTLIDFTVLTRAVIVAEGMETSLRCQSESDVEECRWRWHQLGEANEPSLVVRRFLPYGSMNQDCSIQFTSMLMEQQGVWVCGVRLKNETDFKEALPTTVSLKPAGRIRIIEISMPKIIAENEQLTLTCIASASVNECAWEWKPFDAELDAHEIRFLPDTKDNRNCSLTINKVQMKHGGHWRCKVRAEREKGPIQASTDPITMTIVQPEDIKFKNITTVVHVSPGSNSRFTCEVSHEVEMCRWKFLGASETIKEEFPPVNGTDCTLELTNLQVLNSGTWKCGAKNIGQRRYIYASPITLNVLHTENITTSSWISKTNKLNLVCHLETRLPSSIVNCHWLHLMNFNSSYMNITQTESYEYFDETNGDCILEIYSQTSDFGIWQCLYTVDTENGTWNLGEAKFLVLNNPNNIRLRWVVGILASTTVILAIVLGIVIIYGCPWTKVKLTPPPAPIKQSIRYTEEPGKINFNFNEMPKLLVDFSQPVPSSSAVPVKTDHMYERVGNIQTSVPTLYQNIK